MAHVDDNQGPGRRVSVDLNIVPVIDLMSVLIIFLLISAVWSQVSMIQIGSSVYGKKTIDEESTPPPQAEIPFRLDVKDFGYRVVVGNETFQLPKKENNYDAEGLKKELRRIKELYPEKVDVIITMSDELPYVHLIEGMDSLLASGFPEIAIATGGTQ